VFEWDGGDCRGSNVNTQYCTICECLDPNAVGSRKKQNPNETISLSEKKQKKMKKNKNPNHLMFKDKFSPSNIHSMGNHLKNERVLSEIDAMARMEMEHFYLEQESKEMLIDYKSYHRKSIHQHRRKSQSRKLLKSSKSILRASTKPNSQTKLKHSHHASSKFGLTVILNPKEAQRIDFDDFNNFRL
jgi:hypothetical protein